VETKESLSQRICKHILFFAMHKAIAPKNKKSLQANAPDNADISASLTRQNNGQTEARTDNSGFKKLGVQWLIEHSTSHQHLWWLDSFVLRNPQLLKPAKRYRLFYEDSANINRQCKKLN
jgi:hypothetical protein